MMPRVLVIEDQEKLRRNLQQVLQNEGYDARTAATGEEGIECAATQPIDVLILGRLGP